MTCQRSLRRTVRALFHVAGVLVLSGALAGCAEPSPFVMRIEVFLTSGSNVLAPGQSIQLSASARFSDGRIDDVTRTAVWRSENDRVATVAAGLVTAVSEGETSVVASFEGARGMLAIQVRATPSR